MADPSQPKTSGQKPFAEFLREAPRHHGGTVTLTGRIAQSDKEGHFVLDTGGGQTIELPTDSVHSYKVVEEAGRLVEIEVHRKPIFQEQTTAASLDQITLKELTQDTLKEAAKDPIHDTVKELSKDPIFDTVKEVYETLVEGGGTLAEGINDPGQQVSQPGFAAAVPFTLAAAHQAPQNALALQGLSGQVKPLQDARTIAYLDLHTTAKETVYDTLKESHKDPIQDTVKEVVKDPTYDTVKEIYETLVEGGGTLVEGGGTLVEGTGNPGSNQF